MHVFFFFFFWKGSDLSLGSAFNNQRDLKQTGDQIDMNKK